MRIRLAILRTATGGSQGAQGGQVGGGSVSGGEHEWGWREEGGIRRVWRLMRLADALARGGKGKQDPRDLQGEGCAASQEWWGS